MRNRPRFLPAIVILLSTIAGIGLGLAIVRRGFSPVGNISAPAAPLSFVPAISLPEAPPSPSASPLPAPVVLTIPKLGVNAGVEQVGLDNQQRMDVPKDPMNVGWYKYGPVPGQAGNAVMDGHLDSDTGPAVFFRLQHLVAGDIFTVTNAVGKTSRFRITSIDNYIFDQVPMDQVFGPADIPRLNLITCGGSFDRASKNYSHRLVVYSEKIPD